MKTNPSEDVRGLAQACLTFVKGGGLEGVFQVNSADMAAARNLIQIADEQRVMPIVCAALSDGSWKQTFATCGVLAAEKKTAIYYLYRNMMLRAQLKEIDDALSTTRIFPILLKGSVRLFDDLYPNLGMRHMEDIDFLVDDTALLGVLADIGYSQVNGANAQWIGSNGERSAVSGAHHWPPLIRSTDLVALEPHFKAVSLRYEKWLPDDFATNVKPLKGCNNLRCPSLKNQLILNLVHVLKHDRDTLPGALFLRGIVECELMFERLSPSDRQDIERHFVSIRRAVTFQAWRALADWVFKKDNAARYRSVSAFLLITEFQLRSSSYSAVFVLGFLHRFIALFDIRFWSSGLHNKMRKRLFHADFWQKVFEQFKRAIMTSKR